MPDVPSGNYCLGYGFPDGKCRDYLANNANTYLESNNSGLMQALRTVSNLPQGPRVPVNGTIGPYINVWPYEYGFTITSVFNGTPDDCPAETVYVWDDGNGRLLCAIDVYF